MIRYFFPSVPLSFSFALSLFRYNCVPLSQHQQGAKKRSFYSLEKKKTITSDYVDIQLVLMFTVLIKFKTYSIYPKWGICKNIISILFYVRNIAKKSNLDS